MYTIFIAPSQAVWIKNMEITDSFRMIKYKYKLLYI